MSPQNENNEKHELVEQALQQSIGGGTTVIIKICELHCHILSANVCDFSCSVRIPL
jgi:hypothetical protein